MLRFTEKNNMKTFTLTKHGKPVYNFIDEEVAELYITSIKDKDGIELHTVESIEMCNVYPTLSRGEIMLMADCGNPLDFIDLEVTLDSGTIRVENGFENYVVVEDILINGVTLDDLKVTDNLKKDILTDADELVEKLR